MSPERTARLVARWVRLYTRSLPTPVAERRLGEIDADLHDHITHERTQGTGDARIALSILSRMVRGLAADASWRGHHAAAQPSTPNGAMKTHKPVSRSTAGIVLAAACILALPAVAMQVTDEVAWGPVDFALAGVLLIGAGLVRELAARRADPAYSAAAAVAVAGALMLVVSTLAVGVIGETGDPADLMYGGVLAIGIVGAVVARFRPLGMARALLATALAQALVAVIALIAGKHEAPISSVAEIVGVNAIFVALFVGSALLFRHAARATPAGHAAEA